MKTSREEEGSCASFPFAHPQKGGRTNAATDASEEGVAAHLASPEKEAASLRELREQLSDVPHEEKSALVHVQRVAPDLVDDDHVLRFLRGECFDVRLALKRLLRHWYHRCKIFGPDKYALPMTLSGAMKDNIQALKQGYITLLPVRDEAGRPIIYSIHNPTANSDPTIDEKLQMLWYLLDISTQDPVALRRGYTVLCNATLGRFGEYNGRFSSQAALCMDRAFPIRWHMAHICHPHAIFPLVAQAVKAILSLMQRESLVLHKGSTERVLESLSKLDLPRHCVPTDLGGTLCVSTDAFVRDRLNIEGRSLDMNENVAKSPTPSHISNNGSSPVIDNNILVDFIHNPSPTSKNVALTFTRHPDLPLESVRKDTVISKKNLTNLAREVIAADGRNSTKGEYASAESSIANNNAIASSVTEKDATDHSIQKLGQRKRKKENDPGDEIEKFQTTSKVKKGRVNNHGQNGDPRMNQAVQARVDDPNLTLMAALSRGGFIFADVNVSRVNISNVKDADGVTIYQRRNQLLRRLRALKQKANKK